MNRFWALGLAIMVPLLGYFILSNYGGSATPLPKHYYFPDTVIEKTVRGKKVYDTVWHSVKNFKMINHLGDSVSLDDLKGKILIVNFFFTRCPTICPRLTRQMKEIQNSFSSKVYNSKKETTRINTKITDTIVHFLSVSIDSKHDSVPNMRKFAERFNVNPDNWWLVNMGEKHLKEFANKEMRANVADTKVDTSFIHTTKFFLLDRDRVVRGYFEADDKERAPQQMKKLVETVPLLYLEKDRKKPSILRGFIPKLPYIFIGIGIVFFGMYWISKNKEK